MHRFDPGRPWQWLVISMMVGAAALPLWTESRQGVPAAATPWPAVAKADTPAVEPMLFLIHPNDASLLVAIEAQGRPDG